MTFTERYLDSLFAAHGDRLMELTFRSGNAWHDAERRIAYAATDYDPGDISQRDNANAYSPEPPDDEYDHC